MMMRSTYESTVFMEYLYRIFDSVYSFKDNSDTATIISMRRTSVKDANDCKHRSMMRKFVAIAANKVAGKSAMREPDASGSMR